MSMSVRVKTEVKNEAIVRRLCALRGWQLLGPMAFYDFASRKTVTNPRILTVNTSPQSTQWAGATSLRFNLDTGEVVFDGDYAHLRQLVTEIVSTDYLLAAGILQAETNGWDYSYERSIDGGIQLTIDVPETATQIVG